MPRFTYKLAKHVKGFFYRVTDSQTGTSCTCSPNKLFDVINALNDCVKRKSYDPSIYILYCRQKIQKIFYDKRIDQQVKQTVLIRRNRTKINPSISHEIAVIMVNRILKGIYN